MYNFIYLYNYITYLYNYITYNIYVIYNNNLYYIIINFIYEYKNWGIVEPGNSVIKLYDNYIIIKNIIL